MQLHVSLNSLNGAIAIATLLMQGSALEERALNSLNGAIAIATKVVIKVKANIVLALNSLNGAIAIATFFNTFHYPRSEGQALNSLNGAIAIATWGMRTLTAHLYYTLNSLNGAIAIATCSICSIQDGLVLKLSIP